MRQGFLFLVCGIQLAGDFIRLVDRSLCLGFGNGPIFCQGHVPLCLTLPIGYGFFKGGNRGGDPRHVGTGLFNLCGYTINIRMNIFCVQSRQDISAFYQIPLIHIDRGH